MLMAGAAGVGELPLELFFPPSAAAATPPPAAAPAIARMIATFLADPPPERLPGTAILNWVILVRAFHPHDRVMRGPLANVVDRPFTSNDDDIQAGRRILGVRRREHKLRTNHRRKPCTERFHVISQ